MRPLWKILISFILFVAVCAAGVGWFIDNEVNKELEKAIADTEGLRFEYQNCSVNILDRTVVLKEVDTTLPSGQHFSAQKVVIESYDELNPVPYYAKATFSGLNIPVTSNNFNMFSDSLQEMGVTSIKGDGTLDYTYSPDTATLSIKALSLQSPDLGDLALHGEIDQLDLVNPRLEQLIGVRIKTARLDFTDRSLMDRLVTDWAGKLGVSREEVVDRITAELGGLAAYARSRDNDCAENSMRGLKRFVADPGSITVTVAPTDPVPLLYFVLSHDMMEKIQMLNISIETDSNDHI